MSRHTRGMRLRHVGDNVTLEDVEVRLGGQSVLRGVNLVVPASEVVGISGPNGSGKTTLLRLIATLLRPHHGSGTVLGATLGTGQVYEVRPRIGLIGHVPSVVPELTLRENLEHAVRLTTSDLSRIDPALRAVGLDEAAERKVESSSFGMLRRTEVGRLLITQPHLLLLDEAFSGLDFPAQELIDALISRATGSGGSVVMVSHDASQLSERANRMMMLSAGRLEAPR